MNNKPSYDFLVDKLNHTVTVKRAFAAPVDLVWEAWTQADILDQWWAPKPYRTETKSMDFREGGHWYYAMVSPTDERHWCRMDYLQIQHAERFSGHEMFCDENGKVNPEMPRAFWESIFAGNEGSTNVTVKLKYNSLADIENIVALGFKEGFAMALDNLDAYLEAQFALRKQYKQTNGARVCTYLNFAGNTEEAFLFYKSVFKKEFSGKGIQRFGDLPPGPNQPPVADSIKKMVLHVELPITGDHILMATDSPEELGFHLERGNNMHICIEPDTREEAERIFHELSLGGNITMPLQDVFFGAYYGTFTDRFGINWMINYQNN